MTDTGRSRALPGELRALWAAVLSQAIDDLQRDPSLTYVPSVRRALLHWQRDACAWFISEAEGRQSFIWVCELLRMDPGYVRDRVMRGETAI